MYPQADLQFIISIYYCCVLLANPFFSPSPMCQVPSVQRSVFSALNMYTLVASTHKNLQGLSRSWNQKTRGLETHFHVSRHASQSY